MVPALHCIVIGAVPLLMMSIVRMDVLVIPAVP